MNENVGLPSLLEMNGGTSMEALREQCEKVLSEFVANLHAAAKLEMTKVTCDSTNNNAETVRDGYMYATCEIPHWLAVQCGLAKDEPYVFQLREGLLNGGMDGRYLTGWDRQWARTRTKNSKR